MKSIIRVKIPFVASNTDPQKLASKSMAVILRRGQGSLPYGDLMGEIVVGRLLSIMGGHPAHGTP